MTKFMILITILNFCLSQSDGYPRQENIDILNYYFDLKLSDMDNSIYGKATISAKIINKNPSVLYLDLMESMVVKSIKLDFTQYELSEVTHKNNKIVINLPKRLKAESTFYITIEYEGIPKDGLIISENKHFDRTFFGDNWPNRARHWLPSIDHPSEKASVAFAVTAPSHYQVVANGLQIERSNLQGDLVQTIWRQSIPISTKVMVIGVAKFAMKRYVVITIENEFGEENHRHLFLDIRGGRNPHTSVYNLDSLDYDIQSWVYPQERVNGFSDYSTSAHTLFFFQELIGPYPYEKLANVQSKTRYGGMENASNIFYHENSIDGKNSSESLIAHEVAHQWFGNSATEDDWHHVWLSEGFATYMTHMYLEHRFDTKKLNDGLEKDRKNILKFHEQNPERSLIDKTIKDYNDVLNTYSYQKGSWLLHMLRKKIGDDLFTKTLSTYYTTFRDSNAVSDDFIRIAEDVSSLDLQMWFHQWLYYPENPNFKIDVTMDGDVLIVNVEQLTKEIFNVELDFRTESKGKLHTETLKINKKTQRFGFDFKKAPEKISLDPDLKLLFKATVNYK